MFQNIDNMNAACILHVKVGRFSQLHQSNVCHLTVHKIGIVRLTIQHEFIVSVNFSYYNGDYLIQISKDNLSPKECPIHIRLSWDFYCHTPQLIPVYKHTISDWLLAHCGTVEYSCNLQPCAVWFILSIMNKWVATCSILTWSSLYIPQDFPLLFIIMLVSYSTQMNHGYQTSSGRCKRIQM